MRRSRLLEPVGAVPVEVLHQAMAESDQIPQLGLCAWPSWKWVPVKWINSWPLWPKTYKNLPIIACWRPIGASPNEVIDVWKSPEPEKAYQPADEFRKQFMRMVREVAPKERVVRMVALPYSPLR